MIKRAEGLQELPAHPPEAEHESHEFWSRISVANRAVSRYGATGLSPGRPQRWGH